MAYGELDATGREETSGRFRGLPAIGGRAAVSYRKTAHHSKRVFCFPHPLSVR